MGIVKTKGIIIAENNAGDFDKMLTMLTPGLGKIGCAAKGARRQNSTLLAGSQFLCFGEYMLYKGKSTYNINSCETIELFYNIRIDLDKLNYATYITRIINDVTIENQNSYKILQLYLNTLYTISERDKNLDLVLSMFKMRLLAILGFMPQIRQCTRCKQQENISYFSIKENGFQCENCGKQDKSTISISESTKKSIQYAILADPKKLYSLQIPKEAIKELEIVSKLYLNEKLEKEYKMNKY